MTFTFDTGVPNANNNPSTDQPKMQTNNVSIDGILAVDHISFETQNGGTHKKVTLIDKASPGAAVDPASFIYSANGVDNIVHPQAYFKNSQSVYPLSGIKAFTKFVTVPNGNPVVLGNSWNITSVSNPVPGILGQQYDINIAANALSSTDYLVFITTDVGGPTVSYVYFIISPTVLQLHFLASGPGVTINILIIQI